MTNSRGNNGNSDRFHFLGLQITADGDCSHEIKRQRCLLLGRKALTNVVKVKSHNSGRLFATPWTVAHQAPPSMGFSRRDYWSGLPFCPPGDLPNPGIKPRSPTLQADALTSEPPGEMFIRRGSSAQNHTGGCTCSQVSTVHLSSGVACGQREASRGRAGPD